MKKTFVAVATAALLVTGFQGNASAEDDAQPPITAKWSAEDPHHEDTNTHLWIVRHAMEIMANNKDVVKPGEVEQLKQWQSDLEQGIYDADHANPYYDNATFASHFYDPDTGKSYIPLAAHAKTTSVKYFKRAGEAYQKGDHKQAFYNLGLALHYIGDLNQPMHAANFTNLSYPQGFHSKYENYVDSFKEDYAVKDGEGYWHWKGTNPEDWLHGTAVAAKKDYPDIVNDTTKAWFVKAAVSNSYAAKWRAAVVPATGKRLTEAQRILAGYMQLWFDTYVNK
ncbi:phospholipase C [Fictibacillus macauensis ZFHKF-1]|uniref:Phospholipase C n=1 Tax=Fictibacillus macauensis ZFHKF-1 TaxID=1196324 RepID=I8AFV4_9BACL|nr:phospholipase C [Fictibacillus macauensis]EIT84269.1 phospholipase C [Fictibacillus macauensis ZFHKF-1]